jgi:hypothetical protein
VSSLASPSAPSVDIIVQSATADVWLLSGMLAAIARDQMVATLTASLATYYAGLDPATCIPSAQRPTRLEELRAKLFTAEIAEEGVIVEARRGGMMLDRRADASPAAVLAVVDEPAAA